MSVCTPTDEACVRAAGIVGCKMTDTISILITCERSFSEEWRAAVGIVAFLDTADREPVPTIPEVRRWLKQLGNAFSDRAEVEARSVEMFRYFLQPDKPRRDVVSRIWKWELPPEGDPYDLTSTLEVLRANRPASCKLDFTHPADQWLDDVATLYQSLGGGGRPTESFSPRRWAARAALELFVAFQDGGIGAKPHMELASLILECAIWDEDSDLSRLCREERDRLAEREFRQKTPSSGFDVEVLV